MKMNEVKCYECTGVKLVLTPESIGMRPGEVYVYSQPQCMRHWIRSEKRVKRGIGRDG